MEIDVRLLSRRVDVLEGKIRMLEAERDAPGVSHTAAEVRGLTARIKDLHTEQLEALRTMQTLVGHTRRTSPRHQPHEETYPLEGYTGA